MIRVRLAPSPTGYMHIGTARAGLFVWLFARKNKGAFILRIEDTDRERSKKEYEESIIEGLKGLGIDWDEFYRQSERTEIYKDHLERLVREGKAYPCFCTNEELDNERKIAEENKKTPIYSGKCSHILREEAEARIRNGESFTIRFRMPSERVIFNDMIRGQVQFDTSLIGDIVIAKNYEEPLYNFVVVVDDALMNISHVIRGEDHLSNTPKQIMLFKAFGYKEPIYGHLPMILNPDRSKMSKRYGDTSLKDFLSQGYIPEAIINFLALLSWHPKDDREIFSKDELIEEFDMSRVQKSGAVFDFAKLNWINKYYINHILSNEAIIGYAEKYIPENWKLTPKIIDSIKARLEKMSEIKEMVAFYFEMPQYDKELLIWKDKKDSAKPNLELIKSKVSALNDSDFETDILTEKLSKIIPEDKRGEYLWPLRTALSGQKSSPGPFEIMAALGKEETLKRIGLACEKLS